jgi:hypothetical protein
VNGYDEERLAELLQTLPPAPAGWVEAAQELPLAKRGLDDIVARAEADAQFREALVADLEAALEREGYEADPPLLDAVKRRLAEPS